jgi:hypothetical protein
MQRPILLLVAPLAAGGCIFAGNSISVPYDLPPQEFAQDFGSQMGTLDHVSCAMGGDAACALVPVPMGFVATCDATAVECKLTDDVRLVQNIDLSQQKDFPSQVAMSSAVKGVTVGAVHYWTPSNTLDIPTPPIDVYVGSQSVQKETDQGAAKLGTVPSLPAGQVTNCRNGTPGHQDAYCDMPIDPVGQAALGNLAKDYATPFNVVVVTHLVVHGADPIPAGKLDLFVQPTVAFEVIPVK